MDSMIAAAARARAFGAPLLMPICCPASLEWLAWNVRVWLNL
jgi:hypothetical protein